VVVRFAKKKKKGGCCRNAQKKLFKFIPGNFLAAEGRSGTTNVQLMSATTYYFEAHNDVLSVFCNVCAKLPQGIAVDDRGSACTYQTLLKKVLLFR
jgi:hypothetical protein